MTTTAYVPIVLLLADLMRRGIILQSVGGKLRYRPRDRMTPDLASRLKTHKDDVMALLRGDDPKAGQGEEPDVVEYTGKERHLLEDAGVQPGGLPLVDAVKIAFPEAELIGIRRDPTWPRREAARLIREARHDGNRDRAVAMRDVWRERVAICEIDGGLGKQKAELLAAKEMRRTLVC